MRIPDFEFLNKAQHFFDLPDRKIVLEIYNEAFPKPKTKRAERFMKRMASLHILYFPRKIPADVIAREWIEALEEEEEER